MPPSIVLAPDAPAYPAVLRALATPERAPPTLYLRGALPTLPGVAVVGRRAASAEARAFTRVLARDLVSAGFAVWSGGAFGIDAAAHEAALEAGGRTVVVTGAGLDCPYPREHVPLFDRVLAAGGALLSRLPDTIPPRPQHFLARNHVLAALTLATVVVEAGLKSGARSAAAAARKLGRPLGVVPHPPWSEAGAGCAEELAMGARAVTCMADVLGAVGHGPSPRKRRTETEPRLPARDLPLPFEGSFDPLEKAVLGVLGDTPTHLDVICDTVGAPLPAVAGALLTLTLQAVVVEGPAGSYRRGKR
ncbi:DNA-processing protein DprA [Polyangium sorediatum]|uniref:DNA-processing protein DprA n=1 Tax=Polyangium sorediatum TaxID=889274 RepID=A0ABT6P1A6_9BACT|nr:DNA-processing protein DprA [Polyangium sorediatum]MDI1434374.1 DNA-processing protein DprA [Polyangium sorediatum]